MCSYQYFFSHCSWILFTQAYYDVFNSSSKPIDMEIILCQHKNILYIPGDAKKRTAATHLEVLLVLSANNTNIIIMKYLSWSMQIKVLVTGV